MGIIELLLGVVFAAGLAFGIGFGAMGDAGGSELLVAKTGFIASSLAVAAAYWWWQEAEKPIANLIVLGVIAGIWCFAALPLQLKWLHLRAIKMRESPVAEAHGLPETERLVSQAQFAKIAELEAFLGGKDENTLRQLFDLPAILQKNIATQITRLGLIKSGRTNEFFYSNYTDNGSFIMWAKEGHYSVGPSGVHVEAGPKDVLYLVTTSKFQMAQKKLVEFLNSALVPPTIKKNVSDFKDTVNHDTELMIRILDEKMHEDENYFLHNMDMGTPYYGVIVTEFANKITPLKPVADRVLSAIAESWKVHK